MFTPVRLVVLVIANTNATTYGLGALQVLSDALILELLGLLDAVSLCQLSQCSRALYCFCDAEDLWKALVLEGLSEGEGPQLAPAPAPHQGGSPLPSCHAAVQHNGKRKRMPQGSSRKRTAGGQDSCEPWVHSQQLRQALPPPAPTPPPASVPPLSPLPASRPSIVRAIKVHDFYSDLLYQPWHCATAPLPPHWLDKDNVDRRQGLTAQQFREQYEETNRPVQAFREHAVIAGSFDVTMATYLAYAATTWDEMPLYLFDKRFMEACPALGQDFQVPSVFTEDLMAVMGAQRPDFRWAQGTDLT
ncbi:hypothetical protein QJQ45_007246 [Haematococcus lacustris]|nr:hypothetical protein QJQ45_007246 [Haematococcus lacustris]